MYKVLRIVFCILAVICATVTVFIFAYFKLWGFIPLCGAAVFAMLMFVCKGRQEREEKRLAPTEPQGDFIAGKVNDDKKD